MDVRLTLDQQAFVEQAIQAGRLHHAEQAVREALSLWEERERTRAELLDLIDAAETSLADASGREITRDSMLDLAEGVKRRGRLRLALEQATASRT